MTEPTTSPGFKFGAPQFAGVFVLLLVVGVYASSLSSTRWPPSHPYSGFTLTLLGIILLTSQPQMSSNHARAMMVGAVVATLGALAWFASAMTLLG